jgi:hypothetical protein
VEEIQKIFSNREIAYLFWSIPILIFCLIKIPKSVQSVTNSFFANKLVTVYLSMLLYTIIEVFFIYKIGLWNSTLIKDTTFWFITFSFLTLFKSISARNIKDFIPILNDIFKLTIFVEFIINFTSFTIVLEIVMLPLITFIGIIKFLSDKNENNVLSKFLVSFLAIIGFIYFSFSIYKTLNEYSKFTSIENLNVLVLPVLLSFMSLPFYYLVAVYNEYQQIFMRVKFMTNDKKNQYKIKRQIFMRALLNLHTISLLRDKLINFDLFETNDIKIYLDKIKKTS